MRLVVLLLACAACVAAPAAAAAPLPPDLVSDPPLVKRTPGIYTDQHGSRLLLRMDGWVHNRGPGPLEIRGSGPSGGAMTTVQQRIYDDAGGFTDVTANPAPELIYETNDSHRHWHLQKITRYSLWSENRATEVAPAQKTGFCLLDSERVEAPDGSPPTYTHDPQTGSNFCQTQQPQAANVTMGISAGWRDWYPDFLAFQWVDISDVAPGSYWLRADADPEGAIVEAEENNPGAYSADPTIVNGYRADAVAAGRVPVLGATPITLAATRFDDVFPGGPGNREFRIVSPPAGGTLDEPTGEWFSDPTVRYTPKPGFRGGDAFTVAARDAASPFPRTPPAAAVTLTVGDDPGPGVLGISNAPERLFTSNAVQLAVTGPGVEQGVTWSVNGVAGGTASTGTITLGGLYRAPAAPPAGGRVTIGARSASGATGQVSVRIVRKQPVRPAPFVEPPPVPKRGLSRIKLQIHQRDLVAVVSSAAAGKVAFAVRKKNRFLGGCKSPVQKGGAATCAVTIPQATTARQSLFCRISRTYERRARNLTVRARLYRNGKVVATRRARLR